MRQPDIEIYLKDVELPAVTAWLEQAIGPCSQWQVRGQTHKCRAGDIPVTWLHKAVGRWSSLLLDSAQTPWKTTWPAPRPPAPPSACRYAAPPAAGTRNRARKMPTAG